MTYTLWWTVATVRLHAPRRKFKAAKHRLIPRAVLEVLDDALGRPNQVSAPARCLAAGKRRQDPARPAGAIET